MVLLVLNITMSYNCVLQVLDGACSSCPVLLASITTWLLHGRCSTLLSHSTNMYLGKVVTTTGIHQVRQHIDLDLSENYSSSSDVH